MEAGPRLMAKLAITGGGRCNITNTFEGVDSLAQVYPRGANLMRKALGRFGWQDCLRWFRERGVEFTIQPDHCIFPASQDAMQIVHTLERELRHGSVKVLCNSKIASIGPNLSVILDQRNSVPQDPITRQQDVIPGLTGNLTPSAIVLTTGGGTSRILQGTGIELVPDVPSLFTLKINDSSLRSLMGTVVDNVSLGLAGTRFRSQGTLLITDWGVSGPATLRLSSYAARHLADNQYRGTLLINWLDGKEDDARELLDNLAAGNAGKMITNCHPAALTDRLWKHLAARAGIRPDCRWAELGTKGIARFINVLISDSYEITGRARFKEEFVTCGGVSLKEINTETMESRKIQGLYFAGEVLDIDAVTGGFNLQAAWATAYAAAHAIEKSLTIAEP